MTVRIMFGVEEKTGIQIPFKPRGCGAAEIAKYLLSEKREHLNPDEISFLQSVVDNNKDVLLREKV